MTSLPTGSRLVEAMDRAGVTIPELVARLEADGHKLSDSTIKRLRAGADPDVSTLLALSKCLGVGIADLLLDPATPDWSPAWMVSDASARESAAVLRMVRLVDNGARRYRDAAARRDLAPDSTTGQRAAADAFDALSDLAALQAEAADQWPDAAGDLVPADVLDALRAFVADTGRWFVGDPPDAHGRTSGTLGSGDRTIAWPNTTEDQVLRTITERNDS